MKYLTYLLLSCCVALVQSCDETVQTQVAGETGVFTVSLEARFRLSVEFDGLGIVFDRFDRLDVRDNMPEKCCPILRSLKYDTTYPYTKKSFEDLFASGKYKALSIEWRESFIELYCPALREVTSVPLTMEFIDFVKRNTDHLTEGRDKLRSKEKLTVQIAFGLFFFKHLGIPALDNFLGLEADAEQIINFINIISLPEDAKIAPGSGLPGIIEWINERSDKPIS